MRGAYAHGIAADAPADEAFYEDRIAKAAIVNGSNALSAALHSGFGPNKLVWREFSGAARAATHRYPEAVTRAEERDAQADKLRVSRDPCPKCGTRGDVGCKHIRVHHQIHDYLTKPELIDAAWDRELMIARKVAR